MSGIATEFLNFNSRLFYHGLLNRNWQCLVIRAVKIADWDIQVGDLGQRSLLSYRGLRLQLRSPVFLLFWREIVVEETLWVHRVAGTIGLWKQ